MIRIAITVAAYDAIAATLPLGSVGYEAERAENVIRIDTVRVGNRVLRGVIAGVSPEQASPLLGFPVLNQAGRFTIDTKNSQLIFD
jgi:hypothetical protein